MRNILAIWTFAALAQLACFGQESAKLPVPFPTATFELGAFAAVNLFQEFAPQIPLPFRLAISLIGR